MKTNNKTGRVVTIIIAVILLLAVAGACAWLLLKKDGGSDDDSLFICDGSTITSLTAHGKTFSAIIIPDKIDDVAITAIGKDAFSGNTKITSISIPSSVTSIGDGAFNGCSALATVFFGGASDDWSKVTIGDKNATLNKNTLYYYSANEPTVEGNFWHNVDNVPTKWDPIIFLTDGEGTITSLTAHGKTLSAITIPNSIGGKTITAIGESAFSGNTKITSVSIPSSVTQIKGQAFNECSGLTAVAFAEGSQLSTIGIHAFYFCSKLTSIIIPASVTNIGSRAFEGCGELGSIVVESGNTTYKSDGNCLLTYDGKTLILGCKNSKIPNSVQSIGARAFYACSKLTSITIPNDVTSIGDEAFEGCEGLTSMTIGNNVASIGKDAFWACNKFMSITVANGNTTYKSEGDCLLTYDGKTLILGCKNSTIPYGVETIEEYAFAYRELDSITIPDSVTSIGDGAFEGCGALADVYYSGSEEGWNKIVIGENNTALTNANIYCKGQKI